MVQVHRSLSLGSWVRSRDADDRGWNQLHIVARKGDLKDVRCLLDEGLDVNAPAWGPKSPGATALHLAAQGGHVKTMDELLECGANIDARTKGACGYDDGFLDTDDDDTVVIPVSPEEMNTGTPLHIAAKERNKRDVRALIENGAFLPPDMDDQRFNPPLHYCSGLQWAYEMKRMQDKSNSAGEASFSSEN